MPIIAGFTTKNSATPTSTKIQLSPSANAANIFFLRTSNIIFNIKPQIIWSPPSAIEIISIGSGLTVGSKIVDDKSDRPNHVPITFSKSKDAPKKLPNNIPTIIEVIPEYAKIYDNFFNSPLGDRKSVV